MVLFGDYHTHTNYSDGRSTLEQNVKSASEKGLKQYAVTDHSYSHMLCGITKRKYAKQTEMIKDLKSKYNIDILHGVETNLRSFEGDIDIKPEDRNNYDILVMGFHYTYKPTSFKNFFNFWLPSILHIKSKKRTMKNTQAYINAISRHKIDIIAHLNYAINVDPVEIAKVAKEKGVYIELNAKHLNFTDKQLKEMADTGVKFVIDSDAHHYSRVGKNNAAFAAIERLSIPVSQIANIDKFPKFYNYNKDMKY